MNIICPPLSVFKKTDLLRGGRGREKLIILSLLPVRSVALLQHLTNRCFFTPPCPLLPSALPLGDLELASSTQPVFLFEHYPSGQSVYLHTRLKIVRWARPHRRISSVHSVRRGEYLVARAKNVSAKITFVRHLYQAETPPWLPVCWTRAA